MSESDSLGLSPRRRSHARSPDVTFVMVRRPLQRILSFTGRTIDDVVNDPIAKNEVLGYFKLHKNIQRQGEISELERQWNALR